MAATKIDRRGDYEISSLPQEQLILADYSYPLYKEDIPYWTFNRENFTQAFTNRINHASCVSLFNPKAVTFRWLSKKEIQAMVSLLDGNLGIKNVEIYLKYFSPENMAEIMQNLPNLRVLKVDYNGSNPSEYSDFLSSIVHRNQKIRVLDLRNLKTISRKDVYLLQEALSDAKSLIEFRLDAKKMSLREVKALCLLLSSTPQISTFTLKTSALDSDSLYLLADTINNTSLSHVTLVCDTFDWLSLLMFSKSLQHNMTLKSLELFDLSCQAKGKKALDQTSILLNLKCIESIVQNTLIIQMTTNYRIADDKDNTSPRKDFYIFKKIRSLLQRNQDTRNALAEQTVAPFIHQSTSDEIAIIDKRRDDSSSFGFFTAASEINEDMGIQESQYSEDFSEQVGVMRP